ncbi:MAG: NlpC/P60 family protein [Micromonosporaceae bacterium]
MATSVRVRRRTGGISLLLSGLLVAGAPTSAWAQPDQVPDPGARPAPVGEVRLPDGTSARIPSDPDPMAGPLAGQIAATEARIAALVARLREVEPRLDEARRVRREAEAAWREAEADRARAQAEFDALVDEAYREAAAVPEPLLDFPIPELSENVIEPADNPIGAKVVARRLARMQRLADQADAAYRAALDAERALETQVDTYEAQLAGLQTELDNLRDRNATLLAQQEAEEQRRASERSYPLQTTVNGLRAHPLAQQAVRFALAQLGKPYEWGAEGPDRYDCSGLVWAAYRSVGVSLPRVAADQYNATRIRPVARQALLPGDLVFFSRTANWRDIHHVGMYIGEGRMVHAPNRNDVVKISPIPSAGYFGATRVVEAVRVGPSPSPGQPSPGQSPSPGTRPTPPGPGTGPTPGPSPSPTPALVTVPSVTGLSESAARSAIESAGLRPAAGNPFLTSEGECVAGRVARQQPPAGSRVPVGTTVTYHVCAIVVPATAGLSESAAVDALENAGLQVKVEYVVADAPLGQVVSSVPPAGFVTLSTSTVVTIQVAGVAVPDVVGMAAGEATTVLTEGGWQVSVSPDGPGSCTTLPDERTPDTVACQFPAPGTVVARPGTVTIVVFPAETPDPSTSPDPSGTPSPDPSPTATATAASRWDPGLLVPPATEKPVVV